MYLSGADGAYGRPPVGGPRRRSCFCVSASIFASRSETRKARSGGPRRGQDLSADAVADMGRMRRVDDFDRLEARILHAIEQALASTEEDGNDLEHELIDHSSGKGLPDC